MHDSGLYHAPPCAVSWRYVPRPLACGCGHLVPPGLLLGRRRVGGSAGEALDVNRTGLAVLCPQALDVPLRYIEFLGYHLGTPARLQLPDGVPYGPVRQLWLHVFA